MIYHSPDSIYRNATRRAETPRLIIILVCIWIGLDAHEQIDTFPRSGKRHPMIIRIVQKPERNSCKPVCAFKIKRDPSPPKMPLLPDCHVQRYLAPGDTNVFTGPKWIALFSCRRKAGTLLSRSRHLEFRQSRDSEGLLSPSKR
jgi:hypothetical protein